jgi:GTP-binding protein
MIIGENSRDQDLIVNITKAKQLTNVRAAGSDENVLVIPARKMSLEQGIVYIEDDELIEITPRFIRLRKKQMKEVDRKKAVVDDD